MESASSNKGKKKGKQIMAISLDEQKEDTTRDPNWTAEETTHLLNAVHHVQTRRGRVGLNFTSPESSEIFRFFKASLPNTTREKEKLLNRLKVLMKMYKACNELANRSGGGWDDKLHRPIAPSEAEYVDMVRAKGKNGKFLLKNGFPWYRQMMPMVGGQSSRGDITNGTYMDGRPILPLMNSQPSIEVSEQGSSDDADEGNRGDESNSYFPTCDKTATNGQSSDASIPRSRNSGSKRKSTTDDSSEPSSRGKRYKDRYRKKKAENERLVDAAFQIVNLLREDLDWKINKEEETRKVQQKFKEYGIVDNYHDFAMSFIDNDFRRKWFLDNDRTEIVSWIKRNIQFTFYNPIPNQGFGQPNQGFGQPNTPGFNHSSFMGPAPPF